MERHYKYVIVGAGLAGASAVEGIRERDPDGTLLLIGEEPHLPYHRPPLSKRLWSGRQQVEKISIKDANFYADHHVDLHRGRQVVGLDAKAKAVTDAKGDRYTFDKLLLATGGKPRRLTIPGGDLAGLCYYRTLDDYRAARALAAPGRATVIIGGGFIGSELAASLRNNGLDITMIFPGPYLAHKIFPDYLGKALTETFRKRGIQIEQGRPAAIDKDGSRFRVTTEKARHHEADMVIVGVGIGPETTLAEQAGLKVDNGIVVDDLLASSHSDIFAAGDNARFHSLLQRRWTRLEHWDNALHQGKCAGGNMAGADVAYDYEPVFFSHLFQFGYEALGEIDARLETVADWQKENDTGVIYYLRDNKVRGVMMCNIWGKADEARALVRSGEEVTPATLRGRIN